MEEKDNNTTTDTTRTNDQLNEKDKDIKKEQELKADEEIINLLKTININSDDLLTLVNDLMHFNFELKSLKDINLILRPDIFNIFKNLNKKENIKINLILSKIYMNIMNNDSLYSDYLCSLDDNKTNFVLEIIDECISLIQKLSGFVFDPELFKFKSKTLALIKCIYFNCKQQIKNDISTRKLQELLDNTPAQFFSETFNELNSYKEIFELLNSQDIDKISNFEDKFAQINNYYEQFESFRKFVECNSGVVTYASVGGEENAEKKEEEPKVELDQSKIDFYQQYGLLLLKFCKYHQYVFLNKQNKDEKNKENKEEEENENVRVVFLLDKIKRMDEQKEEEKENKDEADEKKENEENKADEKKENEDNKNNEQKNVNNGNKKIENLMDEKLFVSVTDTKEYNELIKKEINNYLNTTKSLESEPKIKTVQEQLSYFLSILDIDSYVPLYLTDFSKITISDNFTPSFLTNVPAGKTNELYVETKMNETMLVYVEFSLEDKSKDITFEVNKYEINTNTFKSIFKEEKIEDTFKFFILCSGYSLYQIVFNNYYSWFTSKDVNYRITLLKLVEKPKKEISEQNDNEEQKETEEKKEEEKGEPKEEKKEEDSKETKKEELKEKPKEEPKEEKKEEPKKEKKEEPKEEKKEEPTEDNKEEPKEEAKEEPKEKPKEEPKKEKKEDEKDNKCICTLDGKNICLDIDEINNRKKDFDKKKESGEIINIPVILYLNNLRIISTQKGENEKEEVKYIEKKEDDENFVPKSMFDYSIINYLKKTLKKKPADTKDKNILIQIFSQNRDLSKLYKEVANKLQSPALPTVADSINNEEYSNFLKKIGFYPSELLEGYKVEYKLYDLCEQNLIYHLYSQKNKSKKPVLLIQFDKLVVNAAILSKGTISSELKNKDENILNNINVSDANGILDLLKNVGDDLEGFELVLNYVDNYDEENKKILLELFDVIKKYCQEKMNPPVTVYVYEHNEITNNVFNYMNLFYNN